MGIYIYMYMSIYIYMCSRTVVRACPQPYTYKQRLGHVPSHTHINRCHLCSRLSLLTHLVAAHNVAGVGEEEGTV